MSASGCDEYLESSGGLALWASLAFIVVLSFSSFMFCHHRRQKDDEDKLVRYYLAMIQAGKIPNPLVDGNFEVGERRRRRSLEQQTTVGGAATHTGGGRQQEPDLERDVEMAATHSARRRSAPGPPPSTITREDLVEDLATELSALEAAIEASKQLQVPEDAEVLIDEDIDEDEALWRAIEESKQEWTAQQQQQQQQRRSPRTP